MLCTAGWFKGFPWGNQRCLFLHWTFAKNSIYRPIVVAIHLRVWFSRTYYSKGRPLLFCGYSQGCSLIEVIFWDECKYMYVKHGEAGRIRCKGATEGELYNMNSKTTLEIIWSNTPEGRVEEILHMSFSSYCSFFSTSRYGDFQQSEESDRAFRLYLTSIELCNKVYKISETQF